MLSESVILQMNYFVSVNPLVFIFGAKARPFLSISLSLHSLGQNLFSIKTFLTELLMQLQCSNAVYTYVRNLCITRRNFDRSLFQIEATVTQDI